MEDEWEMLQNQEMGLIPSLIIPQNPTNFDPIDEVTEGIIRSDYFSLDSDCRYKSSSPNSSIDSDNPSWVEPDPDPRSPNSHRRIPDEFWSDSSSDASVKHNPSDPDATPQTALAEPDSFVFSSGFELKNELNSHETVGVQAQNSDRFRSGPREGRLVGERLGDLAGKADPGRDDRVSGGGGDLEFDRVETQRSDLYAEEGNLDKELKPRDVEKKKNRMVWFKLPWEVLKLCAFRISPIWSFSIAAAAVMGFVLLGRRLYRMKHKSSSIQLKLSVEDKKVSQFKSHVARLNEAFSVVKRVPIIRASLPPAGGVTPWPAMSLA